MNDAQPCSRLSNPDWTSLERIGLGGFDIVTASRRELCDAMVRDCLAARRRCFAFPPRLVFDANGHGMSMLARDSVYAAAVGRADLIHADGGFLIPASRLLGDHPIKERSATTDLLHDFAPHAVEHGLSYYLLGAHAGVNEECARRLQLQYPGLRIVGRRDGYFAQDEESEVVRQISQARPDLLWVGLGKPKEQLFASRWQRELKVGWIITCGGCFNYVAGTYGRAPHWMRDHGLEWVYRMFERPRQLIWRYATTSPHALWLTLTRTPRR